MNKFIQWVTSFFLKYPALEHSLVVILWAAVLATVGYAKTAQQFQWSALGIVVLAALNQAIQGQKSVLLAFLQDQLDALRNAQGTSTASILAPVKAPSSSALTPLVKASMILFILGILASPAMAWDVPARSFVPAKLGATATFNPPVGGENDFLLMPTAALGFNPWNNQTPSYGYSLAEDLIFANATPGGQPGSVNLKSYLGLGVGLYLDFGPSINSNLFQAPIVEGEANVIGPDLGGVVPGAMIVVNFQNGATTGLINANLPFGLFSGDGIVKVAP